MGGLFATGDVPDAKRYTDERIATQRPMLWKYVARI